MYNMVVLKLKRILFSSVILLSFLLVSSPLSATDITDIPDRPTDMVGISTEMTNISTEISAEILKLLQGAPSVYDYPGAGAVILKNEIEADYTSLPYRVKVTAFIKIFNNKGAKEFSEIKIDYNQNREGVEVFEAGILKLDSEGNLQETKINSIESDIPDRLQEFDFVSEARVKKIVFQNLKQGDVIRYSYEKIINKPLIDNRFSLKRYLQFFEPINEFKMTVKVPASQKMYYRAVNIEAEPQIYRDKEGAIVYSWEFKDLPALLREPALPSPDYFVPYIIVSSYNSWYEFCDWYNGLYTYGDEVAPELKEVARELTKDKFGLFEKIKALYNYVTKEIDYVSLEPWVDSFTPRSLTDVYSQKVGNSIDKSYLLIALLKEIGVVAEPVFINIIGKTEPEIIRPRDLNHMLVYLPEYYLYLEPSFTNVMFGDLPYFVQSKQAIHPLSYTVSKTPTTLPGDNLEAFNQEVYLEDSYSATVIMEWKTRGYFDMLRKTLFREYLPEQRNLLLRQLVNRGFVVQELQIDQLEGVDSLHRYFSLQSTFLTSHYVEEMEGRIFIKPLRIPLRIRDFFKTDKRVNPLYLDTAQLIVRNVEVELPTGYEVFYLPGDVEYKIESASFKVSYREEYNKVITRFELIIKDKLITPQEYLLFRNLLEQVEDVFKKKIVLEKKSS